MLDVALFRTWNRTSCLTSSAANVLIQSNFSYNFWIIALSRLQTSQILNALDTIQQIFCFVLQHMLDDNDEDYIVDSNAIFRSEMKMY